MLGAETRAGNVASQRNLDNARFKGTASVEHLDPLSHSLDDFIRCSFGQEIRVQAFVTPAVSRVARGDRTKRYRGTGRAALRRVVTRGKAIKSQGDIPPRAVARYEIIQGNGSRRESNAVLGKGGRDRDGVRGKYRRAREKERIRKWKREYHGGAAHSSHYPGPF